jgi:hypothetical protein
MHVIILNKRILCRISKYNKGKLISFSYKGCSLDNFATSVDSFATYGHLSIIQLFLKDKTSKRTCTKYAMDNAAHGGHLHIIKWLHNNRTEGCTNHAMDTAAQHNYMNIVKWLHENRTEGCSDYAMDYAAQYGHHDMLRWLHNNRHEGISEIGISYAYRNKHYDIIEFLKEHCSDKHNNYLKFSKVD